jgi:Flp pilus assembly protein TadG
MSIIRALRERAARRGRGQTLVEFAMVLPVILAIMLALFDLGRAVYSTNTLAQAARSGSRMAMVSQNVTNVRNAAIAAAATLGLSSSNVDVCFKTSTSSQTGCSSSTDNCPQSTRVIGCLAIVRAHINYAPMTPVISVIWPTLSLSSTSIASIEYVCPEGTATTCP